MTTQPPTTTTLPPFTVDDALAVNDAYFAAYERSDVDAMLALFTPDALWFGAFGAISIEEWEQLYVWKVAEGTVLTARDCTATASQSAREVAVRCGYGHHEYLSRAVDGNVVPHTMSMVVTPAGVKRLTDRFGSPDFNVVGEPFSLWMEEQHQDDAPKIEFGNWSTVEEARQNGLLTAQFVDKWAAYLDTNGCGYLHGC